MSHGLTMKGAIMSFENFSQSATANSTDVSPLLRNASNSLPNIPSPDHPTPISQLYKSISERIAENRAPFLPTNGDFDDSSLNSSPRSSSIAPHSEASGVSGATSQLLDVSTMPNGEIDFVKLKAALSAQRKKFEDELKMERAKREALEDLLLKMGGFTGKNQASCERKRNNKKLNSLITHELAAPKRGFSQHSFSCGEDHSSRRTYSVASDDVHAKVESLPPIAVHQELFYHTSLVSPASVHNEQMGTLIQQARQQHTKRRKKMHSQRDGKLRGNWMGMDLATLPQVSSDDAGEFEAAYSNYIDANHPQRCYRMVETEVEVRHAEEVPKPLAWFVEVPAQMNKKVRSKQLDQVPSLQDSLSRKLPAFQYSCRSRLQKISIATNVRRESERQMAELAEQVAKGERPMPQAELLYLLERRKVSAFPVKEMTALSKRKFHQLPEYQQRLLDKRRDAEKQTNRVRAEMLKQRILYKILKNKNAPVTTSGECCG